LAKVFEIDSARCPPCGQKSPQQIAVIHDESTLRALCAAIERRGRATVRIESRLSSSLSLASSSALAMAGPARPNETYP
jgi:hypothetical protein